MIAERPSSEDDEEILDSSSSEEGNTRLGAFLQNSLGAFLQNIAINNQ